MRGDGQTTTYEETKSGGGAPISSGTNVSWGTATGDAQPLSVSGDIRVLLLNSHAGNITHLTSAQRAILDLFEYDATNHSLHIKKVGDNAIDFWTFGNVSAGGNGGGGEGGDGTLYALNDVLDYNGQVVARDATHPAQIGDILAFDGDHWHAVEPSSAGTEVSWGTTGTGTQVLTVDGVSKTLITAHQSLSAYRTAADQDTIDNAIKARLGDTTSTNPAADKAFVNSSIATSTATFRGTSASGLTEAQFLSWANGLTKDNNDYVFWNTTDSDGNTLYKRYKYNGSSWVYEYALNNSSFTAAQWSAINSGITSNLVSKLNGIASGAQVNVLEKVKLNGSELTITSKAVNVNAVTSLNVPTGLSAGNLGGDGNIAISFTSGYSIPTTNKQTSWDTGLTTLAALKAWIESLFVKEGSGTTADPYRIKANYDFYSVGNVSAGGNGGSGGGGGEAVWGAITGTLSNQTDLMTVLNSKQSSLGSGSEGQILKWTGGIPTWSAAPATGVTSLGGQTGAITLGSNLSMSAGGVLSATDTTYSNATQSAAGLMSSADKTKLDGIATGATAVSSSTVLGWGFVKSVASKTPDSSGNVALTKSDVGLGNVDNTADANKIVARANYADVLRDPSYYDSYHRRTSANINWADGGLHYYLATSSMTEGKPTMGDGHILHMSWDNGSWEGQLVLPTGATGDMQWRTMNGGTWGGWNTIYDSHNFTASTIAGWGFAYSSALNSYLPLSGGTMTGNITLPSEQSNWNFSVGDSKVRLIASRSTAATGAPGTYYGGLSAVSGYVGFQLAVYGGGDEDLKFRKLQDTGTWHAWRTIYHSGNANNTSTPWSASTLTVGSGGIKFATNGESFDQYGNVILSAASGNWHVSKSDSSILFRVDATNGNVGINTGSTAPAAKLHVNGGGILLTAGLTDVNVSSPKIYFYGAGTLSGPYIQAVNVTSYGRKRLSVFQHGSADYTTAQNEVFTINYDGNVGIGTTSPTAKLYVKAGDWITSILESNNSSGSAIQFYTPGALRSAFGFDSTTGTYLYDYNTTKRLYINTSTGVLTFSGNITIAGTISGCSGINFTGSGAFNMDTYGNFKASTNSTSNYWNIQNSSGTVMLAVNAGTGNVAIGLGSTQASEKLHVSGNILATGNVTAGSDRRWKDNIDYRVDGISAINALRPATWVWKEGHGNGKGAGLIAQDVQSVLPYAVVGSDKDGYTLNYNVFHAFEISALQNHESRIEYLERENRELKAEIKRLRA